MTSYELWLPVYKQGDDLAEQLQKHQGDCRAALVAQAECYEKAAVTCRELAAVDLSDITFSAQTHSITWEGPEERLKQLVKRGLLQTVEWEE